MRDDTQLVADWQGGDRAAAQELIERHYDSVVRFFRTKAGANADDLVQRTFLRLAESKDRYRGESSFRAFIFGVARNVLFEFIRGRARDGKVDPDFGVSSILDMNPGVSTVAFQRAEQRLMVQALQHIPVDLQVLLELYYWEDLSVAELADVLGVPAGTIKSRLHRGRTLLREAMEKVPASGNERRSLHRMLSSWVADVRGQPEHPGDADDASDDEA